MGDVRRLTWGAYTLLAMLTIGLMLATCSGKADTDARITGLEVPKEFVEDFLAHPHFSKFKTEPTDLRWQVYEETDSQRIVAATFRAKDESGQDRAFYYLAVYGPGKTGEKVDKTLCVLDSIDDFDFDVSGFSVSEKKDPNGTSRFMLTATGLASDAKVTKVTLETSEARTLTAAMYGRFWMVNSEAVSPEEKVTRTVGYAQDGTILYQYPPFAMVKGSKPIRGPSVPEEIVRDFYSDKPQPTDVQWQLCVQEGDRMVVGVLYKLPNRNGEMTEMFYLMVYGPQGRRLWGTSNAIQDRGLETGGGYTVGDRKEWDKMVALMGISLDEKVVRVTGETSTGRILEARMYGRFWIVSAEREDELERVTKIVGYDADGAKLYERTFVRGES